MLGEDHPSRRASAAAVSIATRAVRYSRDVTAVSPGQVALDTSVVRALGDTRRPFHADVGLGLRALRDHGFTLHLADGTIAELTSQLSERRIPWPEWVRARSALKKMLNHSEPVLLGGWELLAEAGIFIGAKRPSRSRQDIRAGWKRMEKARSYDELWKVRPFRADGRVVLGGTKRDVARGLVDSEKDSWVEGLDDVADVARAEGVQDIQTKEWIELVEIIGRGFEARLTVATDPPPSVRLDALIRVYARYSRQRVQSVGPYNAEKRANDAFDYDLLRYLALPALVCTCDETTLVQAIEQAGSWQRTWVLGITELRKLAQGAEPPQLIWPIQTG